MKQSFQFLETLHRNSFNSRISMKTICETSEWFSFEIIQWRYTSWRWSDNIITGNKHILITTLLRFFYSSFRTGSLGSTSTRYIVRTKKKEDRWKIEGKYCGVATVQGSCTRKRRYIHQNAFRRGARRKCESVTFNWNTGCLRRGRWSLMADVGFIVGRVYTQQPVARQLVNLSRYWQRGFGWPWKSVPSVKHGMTTAYTAASVYCETNC